MSLKLKINIVAEYQVLFNCHVGLKFCLIITPGIISHTWFYLHLLNLVLLNSDSI